MANILCEIGIFVLNICLIFGSEEIFEDYYISEPTDENLDSSYFPSGYRESVYEGKLSPNCIIEYNRLYVNLTVPPRPYLYFHEAEDASKISDELTLTWRIIGGEQVDIQKAPYAVLYGPTCGGSLIAPNWVMTAAHCGLDSNYITAGSTMHSEGNHYPICAHFLHPQRHKLHFHDYDYQLLLLETPVPVTPTSRPIAIGEVNDIKPGTMVTLSGWGSTRADQQYMQSSLSQVLVPVIPHQVCQAQENDAYKTITPRMFCAGYIDKGKKDSCQGDSGGAVVINNKLVGLISFGVNCAEAGKPGVYTNIPQARPWIQNITGLPL